MVSDRRTISVLALLFVYGPLLACVTLARADEDSSLTQAEERIRLHRQADVQLQVVDSSGNPLSGVEVRIEQTRHAFLFGSMQDVRQIAPISILMTMAVCSFPPVRLLAAMYWQPFYVQSDGHKCPL